MQKLESNIGKAWEKAWNNPHNEKMWKRGARKEKLKEADDELHSRLICKIILDLLRRLRVHVLVCKGVAEAGINASPGKTPALDHPKKRPHQRRARDERNYIRAKKKTIGAEVLKSCKTWKMLPNAHLLAKLGFGPVENEPAKILQNFAKFAKFQTFSLIIW